MLTRPITRPPIRRAAWTVAVALLLGSLLLPATALGHAELVSSTPGDGATVGGPFADPIVMTFSAAVVGESHADLRDSAGTVPASSAIDGDTMTLMPEAALPDGDYQVLWTSIAEDGDIERGTFRFTVAAPASPEPSATPAVTASPTPAPTASSSSPSPSAVASPSLAPSPAASPVPSPSGTGNPSDAGSSGDVILPIVLGALLIAGLAVLLFRRRDSSSTIP